MLRDLRFRLQALMLHLRIRLLLKHMGYLATCERMRTWHADNGLSSEPEHINALVAASEFSSRLLPNSVCLDRGILLWSLLSRHGFPAELKIGVRREGEYLTAHAWVELYNQPIGDRDNVAGDYAAFPGDVTTVRNGKR